MGEPDMDIVTSFAAMQERDLQVSFNRGLVRAVPLSKETSHETFWRAFTISKTTNTKGDSVSITSAMDCLNEPPLFALWSALYTPPASAADVRGVAIPPPEEGHVRSEHSFMVSTITPLRRLDEGDRTRGFRMKVIMEMKLPGVVRAVLSVMPSFLLRKVARARLEQGPRDFNNFVNSSEELRERMRRSPRAPFYEQLRQQLAGELPS